MIQRDMLFNFIIAFLNATARLDIRLYASRRAFPLSRCTLSHPYRPHST